MRFKPRDHYGVWIILALTASSLILAGYLFQRLSNLPLGPGLFWWSLTSLGLFICGLYLLYRALALFLLSYTITRNGLTIRFGALTYLIPIQEIEALIPAPVNEVPRREFRSISLPVWWVGRWEKTHFFATDQPARSILVRTATGDWLISPKNRPAFIRAWELRQELGPTQAWATSIQRWRFFGWPIWFDDLVWRLAGGAILLYTVVIGAIFISYPDWPATFQLALTHQTSLTLPRDRLLWFPAVGSVILGVNLLLGAYWYRNERILAYTIWSIAFLVQIAVWLSVRLIIG